MTGHANSFLLLAILGLVTLLLVFGMKYFSAARQARLRSTNEGGWRQLAEQAAASQAASAASLAALQADLSEMRTRLTAIDTVLREV